MTFNFTLRICVCVGKVMHLFDVHEITTVSKIVITYTNLNCITTSVVKRVVEPAPGK